MDFPGWYRNLWYHRVFIIEGYAVVFLSLLSFALCHCNFKDRRVPHWAAHCTLKLHLGPCFSPWLEKKEFLVDPCPWFPLRWPLAFFWSLLAATDLLESHRYFIWKKTVDISLRNIHSRLHLTCHCCKISTTYPFLKASEERGNTLLTLK